MKVRRIVSLLLAVLMLLGMTAVLSSCGNKKVGVAKVSRKNVNVDLTGYYVVYNDASGSSMRTFLSQQAGEVAGRVGTAVGKNVAARAITGTPSQASDPEILIGNISSRAESQKAFQSIKGNGFTIQVINNKICIVGTNTLLTLQAIQYFLDYYLTTKAVADSKTISVSAKVQANKLAMIKLAQGNDAKGENGGGLLPLVYSAELHDDKLHADPYFQSLYSSHDMRAYPVQAAENVTKELASITGTRSGKDFQMYSDATDASAPEFSVGNTNRTACQTLLADLSGNEYGFLCTKDGCALASWSDAALITAYTMLFLPLLSEATVTADDGSKYVAFPEGFKVTGVHNANWITEFPKPEGEGIRLYNTMDDGEDCLQYLYAGDGIGAEAFDAYCAKLKAAGYVTISENAIEGSKFATLVNNAEGIMLYVALDMFTHKDEYDPNYKQIHYDYDLLHSKVIRVVSCSTTSKTVSVPTNAILKKPASWAKQTDSAITAVGLAPTTIGMSYVVTLEDGSFILFDGGTGGQNVGDPVNYLYDLLKALYKDIFDKDPSSTDPIHLAAWVITHSHGDHYGNACTFMNRYGNQVKLDYIVGNWPASNDAYIVNSGDNGYMGVEGRIASLIQSTGATYLKVHTGQKYYFANVEIEVLMTYEDHNPFRIDNSNDANNVLRFSMYSSANPTSDPTTVLWLGDSNRQQSRWMCAMYGSYLKSDMVQLGHHGNVGCDIELYDSAKPETIWMPNSLSSYKSYTKLENYKETSRPYWVDRTLVYERDYLRYFFVSDVAHNVTLPFSNNGKPDYEKIYDVMMTEGSKTNTPPYGHYVISYVTREVGGNAIDINLSR